MGDSVAQELLPLNMHYQEAGSKVELSGLEQALQYEMLVSNDNLTHPIFSHTSIQFSSRNQVSVLQFYTICTLSWGFISSHIFTG